MFPAAPDRTEIGAAIAKAEWWLRLLEELAETGVHRAGELVAEVQAGRPRATDAADDYARIAAAVREAVALSRRLEESLRGLGALRKGKAPEIATATATATATARGVAEAAARDKARALARARREARTEKIRELVMIVIDREATDAQDHESLTLALERRLFFDPDHADIDGLPLRELVTRICANLRITPEWNRWRAEDWKPRNPVFQADRPISPPDGAPPTDFTGKPGAPIPPALPTRLQ